MSTGTKIHHELCPLCQVTEKTDTYMDNLVVGLELWEKQLMLGGEVDSWAGSKLALFAQSHPFYKEQEVLDMRVRFLFKQVKNNSENVLE